MMYNNEYYSHLNNTNKLVSEQYFSLADEFNPERYEPDIWLKAAAEAGFKYAVMTTKHHEGYALWPSKYGQFSTRTHMGGRDLIKPYVDACRKNGLRVGLYYSPPDWYYNREYMSFQYGSEGKFPERKHFNTKWEPIDVLPTKPEGFDKAYREYIRGQVEELLTQYGRIDVLFFDGGPNAISMERIRELQPGIVVNPRMHGYGDYTTPEGRLPAERPSDWWELCENWTDSYESWGYHKEEKYKPTAWMLSRFSKIRTWGGNYLINVAPRPDGTLPEIYYRRMEELKGWMKDHQQSVIDTTGGPYPEQSNVPVTIKDKTWYFHILSDYKGEIRATGVDKPISVRLLKGNRDLEYSYCKRTLTIVMRNNLRTKLVDVVAVSFNL